MSTYPAGTVAVATVRRMPNVRILRTTGVGKELHWLTSELVSGVRMHDASHVTDVRPLVVLDLEGREATAVVELSKLSQSMPWGSTAGLAIAQMAEQIEAQTLANGHISGDRGAQLIRYHINHGGICEADRAELLRLADQLEAEQVSP